MVMREQRIGLRVEEADVKKGSCKHGRLLVLACGLAILAALIAPGVAAAWVHQESGVTGLLWGVDALDSTRAFAVGSESPGGDAVILRRAASSWTQMEAPSLSGQCLYDVACLDSTHAWAVGSNGKGWFFNGSSWSAPATIAPGGQDLRSVSGVAANKVWAVGHDGKIFHYNGTTWAAQASGTDKDLFGVCAVDENCVWAVGREGTILNFDGTTWSSGGNPTSHTLMSVTAADRDHVWAVGGKGTGRSGDVFFFNGTSWSGQVKDKYYNLYAVSALDKDNVWAVGEFHTVLYYDGTTWSPQYAGLGGVLLGVCAADAENIFAVGADGEILLERPGARRYYFAEGCTREGFSEWLCLQNPGAAPLEVTATYMLMGGQEPVVKSYTVKPESRTSINVNDEVGPGMDVSVMLESLGEFYAERPMYFNYKRDVPGFAWTGGHCATGAPAARTDWYFAEGTTRALFEEWLCIQNPNSNTLRVNVDYISAGAYTNQKQYDIEPYSRFSVFVNGDVGPDQDVSVHVYSQQPIVAERPMYFNYHGKWTGGHVVMGTDTPRTEWYFAEGSTQPHFDEYLAFQNANNQDAIVECEFLESNGKRTNGSFLVGANSRWTLDVRHALGTGVDAAVVVKSTMPIVAERPMYFSYKQGAPGYGWTGGHDVVGSPVLKNSWFFAEGCTYDWADEYICVANPGADKARVTFMFMLESGEPVMHEIDVAAGKRETVKVADIVPRGHDVSTKVVSDKTIIVERPMYFNYNGWTGGHDVIGF